MLPDNTQNKGQSTKVSDPQIGPTITNTTPNLPSGGGILKEKEFISNNQEEKYYEETGKEIELDQEVKEAGVEKIGEEIVLPDPVKKMGVDISGPSTPIPSPSQSLPMDNVQIKKALHKRVTDAILWLAVWCLRQIKKEEIKNKKDKI